jgi:DNA-dependent RNA polymerase auxiliary subunit epsilon
MLTSTTIETSNPVVAVTPEWNATEPSGTSLSVSVSVDNGVTWKSAVKGGELTWDYNVYNTSLKYKVLFETTDGNETPDLHDITLNHKTRDPVESEWLWSKFTWHNDSITDQTVGWKIYYEDMQGKTNCTDIMSFDVGTPAPDTTGPITSNVAAEPNPTNGADTVTLTATIDDSTTGNSVITAAEYFVDTVGSNGTGTAMSASDGAFDSATEAVTADIDVSGLSVGNHNLYVHGKDAAGNWGATESVVLEVTEAGGEVEDKAKEDIPVKGDVTGSYLDTHTSDDVRESITEVLSGGKPANRYSYLEHKWAIDVTGDSDFVFYLEAHHSPSTDGDDFEFAYSKDDTSYTPMVTVTKTTDDNTYQTYTFTEPITGTVYIRVQDTDRNVGNQELNTVYIDHMYIKSKSGSPSYGVTVTIDETSQKVKPGESTAYTVRVKNTGGLDASYSVAMTGTAVDESTIAVSPLDWNTGTLAPNAENVTTVTVSTSSSTPETTYTLIATATCEQDAGVNDSATSELVVSSAEYNEDKAKEDIPVKGTVTGSYLDTHASDNVRESVEEVLSGGKPANRYSLLEHKWSIDVTGDSDFVFYLEAHHSSSTDGDDFEFAYSKSLDGTYTPMVTVTKTADDDTYQTYTFTESITGTVYIRVQDTNRDAGKQELNTVYIDHMYIRSKSGSPSYGVSVTMEPTSQTVAPGNGTTYTVTVKNTGGLDGASYNVTMSGTAVEDSNITVSPLNWNTGTLVKNEENVTTVMVSTNPSTPEKTYNLTATATCEQDASVTDSATSDLVVSSAENSMHVYSIDMWSTNAGPNYKIYTEVKIVDSSDVGVAGATVYLNTTLPDETNVSSSGDTLDDGTVEFMYGPTKTLGTYTSTVTDVAKTGWEYDSGVNIVTSANTTIP